MMILTWLLLLLLEVIKGRLDVAVLEITMTLEIVKLQNASECPGHDS